MPPTSSARTTRIRGIQSATSLDDFQNVARRLGETTRGRSKRRLFSSSSAAPAVQLLPVSLALQNEHLSGTVSFPSIESKREAINAESTHGWELDDHFDGLTVLSAPNAIDLDPIETKCVQQAQKHVLTHISGPQFHLLLLRYCICAVHGLNGNAFDTWMGATKMWLRDLLPSSAPFQRSRIMTFGYTSTLVDKKSNDRLRDWADELLRQIIYLRTSPEERERRIVFICHSLGGLVAREAMMRLNTQANKFDGLTLEQCGLLFLSTPHSGTTQADWNAFLVSLSELTTGVRSHAIVDQLRSFNPASVDCGEAFMAMRKIPPFYCLIEGDKTKVFGKDRTIVTQASAGFLGRTADKILNVDHHGICKFDSKFGGYMAVLDRLKRLRGDLIGMDLCLVNPSQNVPGRPNITAPHYPPASNTKFYEGGELRATSHLVGRTEALQDIVTLITPGESNAPKVIALTGIGGIGKTEILLEIALRYRNIRNVFFIRAHDLASLEDAFLDMATSIGHDLLAAHRSYPDPHAVWREFKPSERVRAFKAWLGSADNKLSLFIVDDVDGLLADEAIKAALPREAPVLLYSTRDPSIIGSLQRDSREFRVPNLDTDEMAALMSAVLQQTSSAFSQPSISAEEFEAVANIANGSALAGCRAVTYIVQVLAQSTEGRPAQLFLDIFGGSDWEARKQFLEFKPRFGLSVMETFQISLERLRRHQGAAQTLLQLMAFLSSADRNLDDRKFLSTERPWLHSVQADLPDYEVFAKGLRGQGEYLAELENVSVGYRATLTSPMWLHPLWIECIQQLIGHEGRERWLRQVLSLCNQSWLRDEALDTMIPFARNCLRVAARFRIGLDELIRDENMRQWLEHLAELDEKMLEAPAPYLLASEEHNLVRQAMRALQKDCEDAAQAFNETSLINTTAEGYSMARSRLLVLLRHLRSLEEDQDLHRDYQTAQLHLGVYDVLISIASLFRAGSPMLEHQLRKRRREYVDQYAGDIDRPGLV